ncbi:galactosyldiacylglycerol synthase [Chloroflexota bacterium]
MIKLYDNESGSLIGTISPGDLQYLVDQLEEETLEDQDYYIDLATIDWFEEQGGDAELTELLRGALGDREGMDIRWSKD